MSYYATDALWRNLPTVTATVETADIDLRAPAKTNKDVNERYSLPGTPIFLVEGLPEPMVCTKAYLKGGEVFFPLRQAGWAELPGSEKIIKESDFLNDDGNAELRKGHRSRSSSASSPFSICFRAALNSLRRWRWRGQVLWLPGLPGK